MATIIAQRVESGAHKLLSNLPVNRFSPRIIGELPIKATGLLAGAENVEWDQYDNPFLVLDGNRVSLAVVLTHKGQVFTYNREGAKNLHDEGNINTNDRLDIIGAVGFGLSSLLYKVPQELLYKKIANVRFSDLFAVEETEGDDLAVVKMPIVVCELECVSGCEEYFTECPDFNPDAEMQTAKLQAAILAIKENV